jgi:hypothetical protein
MMARHSRSANAQALSQRLVARILALPRLARVLLVGLFALAVTLSLSPLVDYIYIEYFFNMDTRILPALVSAAVGLGIYVLGWWLMVGTQGEKPIARTALLWYCGIGLLAVLVVVFLLLRGVTLVRLVSGS